MGALRLLLLALAVVLLFSSCDSKSHASGAETVTQAKAIEISRKAAAASGYDLAKYKLDTFGNELSEDRSEWLIGYLCSPGPPPPGCHFLVVVDRKTGKATVYPGE